ncbi:conserved hypothetical protein [Leishmania braziliensis MHOM/BR/75/M2904]|uniref:Uncharacterized protein n=1 Tax=Leishmania braziliensis TaxID=5660 RepID=E9AI62_LEIBR|nr:conserved hypothetical protein [Leishmania braziliensis MHOM/BR/75/M2904]CAJ2470790.1 unnamed protein product [Leishmania braziliensis]CBZ14497.1 conserved hypothetical protein [Leishmania braziliensis MHOM/BR/75/M2904]
MFGRRVFASAPLPRYMWPKMHIQNETQARRTLPSFTPLAVAGGTRSIFCSGLAFNALCRSSASLGGEEGLVSPDGKLVSAEVAAACAEWCAQALRTTILPIHHLAASSPHSKCLTWQTKKKVTL